MVALTENPLEGKDTSKSIVSSMIEFRVRDRCWHACSVVGEGKFKKTDSKTLY